MSVSDTPETVTADYDDAPDRRVGNPLIRLIRAVGCFLTVLMGGSIAAVRALGVQVSLDAFAGCAVVSVASIPLIMQFWSEEVVWSGGRLAVVCTLFTVSFLTWFAEVILAVFIMFGVSIVLG